MLNKDRKSYNMRGKSYVIVSLGFIISISVIIWMLFKIDFQTLGRAFRQFRWEWIPLLVFVYLAGFFVRGFRWQIMLHPLKPISWFTATSVILIGYMANNVLPARIGEIVRAYVMGEKERMSKISALSSIIVERIFDGLVLVGILAITTLVSTFKSEYMTTVRTVGFLSSILFIVALVVVLIARLKRSWLEIVIKKVSRHLPLGISEKAQGVLHSMLDAVNFLKIDRSLPLFLFLSVFVWIIEGSMFWLGLCAFGLDYSLQLAYFTLAFVNLGLLVPSAPAYVGVFQACTIFAFAAFGLTEEVALSYSIVIHALQFLPITLLGLVLINFYGMTLRRLHKTEIPAEKK